MLTEKETVVAFLSGATCGCKNKCFDKVRNVGASGVRLIIDLREHRLAGKYIDSIPVLLMPSDAASKRIHLDSVNSTRGENG